MSPERARGKVVDKRADIRAFGVVLVEVLTGRSLFTGETVSDTLAAVLRSDIDYSHLPPDTPPGVRNLIERCLEREPAKRLRDIGDAGILMDSVRMPALAVKPAQPRGNWLLWAIGLAGAALAACFVWALLPIYAPEPIRFEIYPPEGATANYPAVSPDGRGIAFIERSQSGSVNVHIRRLGGLEAIPVPGSEAANGRPFWSPDSRKLGVSPDQRYLIFRACRKQPRIWLGDIRRGGTTRLTFNEGNVLTPVLTPDGSRIAYSSERNGESAILIRSANGSGAPETLFSQNGGASCQLISQWRMAGMLYRSDNAF